MNTKINFTKYWLVVDDDPVVLRLTTQALHSLHRSEVVACDNPRQALKVFMADPEMFELLVTDFNMPELDGFELAHHARVQSPRLLVLLISGNVFKNEDVLSAGLDAYLPKPYSIQELLEVVLALLMRQKDHARRWTSPVFIN